MGSLLQFGVCRRSVQQAVSWAASQLAGSEGGRASRLLLSGQSEALQAYGLAIARMLASPRNRLLLLDLSQGAAAVSSLLEAARSPGFAELCQRKIDFQTVICRDPESGCHFLPSGKPRQVAGGWGEAGAADRILRALDESYSILVICAELPEAALLAENLKRPFTAGIVVGEGRSAQSHEALANFDFPYLRVKHRS
jgi:hypothetical protein